MLQINEDNLYLWKNYLSLASDEMFSDLKNNKRELGKLMAIPNEYMIRDYLNDKTDGIWKRYENLTHEEKIRYDLKNNKNYDSFDLIWGCPDSNKKITVQAKWRSSTWHFENTRRLSTKNQGNASKSGHVAYKINEADFVIITVVDEDIDFTREFNFKEYSQDNLQIYSFPMGILEDPNNQGFCRTNIPGSIKKRLIPNDIQCIIDEINKIKGG